jgi:hypothetical protein
MIVCLIVFYGIFSLFAMNKAFGPTGMALLLAFYILILILGLVDFAKRKEEGFQE